MTIDPVSGRVHVQRLRLRNYRSVRECDIALQPGVTFLVGPNGAGKSNVLDGLRFISDALTASLNEAVQARGGFAELHHRGGPEGMSADVSVEITFNLPLAAGSYSLRLGAADGVYEVTAEQCHIRVPGDQEHGFDVSDGVVVSTDPSLPLFHPQRLYLGTAANLPVFRPVFDALAGMRFYNFNPAVMREPQSLDAAPLLARDGRNVASILHNMGERAPEAKKIVEEYLAVVVPGVVEVDWTALGPAFETIAFRQEIDGRPGGVFSPQAMSDGTLRALGVLTAAFQTGRVDPSLVGMEEPEAALHPRAAAVLRDALLEAGERRQIVVTTHSPDLLDDREIDPESILAVEARAGETVVGPPDYAGLSSLQDGLFTAGELLRVNQLMPASPST